MAKNEDELLLGTPIVKGDGRDSDIDEKPEGDDPRGDLTRPGVEADLGNPSVEMPDIAIDTGISLPTGPNVELPMGGVSSPGIDISRDPTASIGSSTTGITPPSDGPQIVGGNKMDLVSDKSTRDEMGHDTDPNVDDEGGDGVDKPEAEEPPTEPPPPPPVLEQTDPDAGGGSSPVTVDEVDLTIVPGGGTTTPVRGGGTPIDADAPPVKVDLVRDGGEAAGDLGEVQPLTGAPDAPLIRTLNPNSGGPVPPAGGGPQGDRTAATLDGDGLQAMDGTADIGAVIDDHLDIGVGLEPDADTGHDEGAFGGPLDDGFD